VGRAFERRPLGGGVALIGQFGATPLSFPWATDLPNLGGLDGFVARAPLP
jgi:hypothetical protein